MRYYKAIIEKHDYFTGYTSVVGELLTAHERNTRFRYLMDDCFKIVNISQKKTCFIFGCRFEKVSY